MIPGWRGRRRKPTYIVIAGCLVELPLPEPANRTAETGPPAAQGKRHARRRLDPLSRHP